MGCSTSKTNNHKPKASKDTNIRIIEQNYKIKENNTNHCEVNSLKTKKEEYCFENIRNYYKIGNIIGTGGFGQVRICQKIGDKTEKLLAIKSIFRTQMIKEIKNEVEILISLDHPNILKMYEYYIDDEFFHIVTELCTGGDLIDRINVVKTIPETNTVIIIFKILSAIAYCHANGIVHRDLKPENILFVTNENHETDIKVIDFNLSKRYVINPDESKKNTLDIKMIENYNNGDELNKNLKIDGNIGESNKNLERMKSVIGTPFYMAPEVLSGSYNEKCDIWAIGVIAYLCISGELPFMDKNSLFLVYNKILNEEVSFDKPIWKEISADCKDFISKCLIKTYEQRLNAQEALKHTWFKDVKKFANEKIMHLKLENLKKFNHTSPFKKLIIKCIVNNSLSMTELKRLREIFVAMDVNNTGYIDREDLDKAFEKAKIKLSKDELDTIIRNCDDKKNGKLDYTEFCMGSLDKEYYVDKVVLKRTFDYLDVDKSGLITTENLRSFFVRTGDDSNSTKSLYEISDLIKEVTEGKDKISFKEMCKIFKMD